MCRQATCDKCNKATWYGCGSHVSTVFSSIPKSDRCSCEPKVVKDGNEYPVGSPPP
ncbi:hypothetical protein P152DRAFT_400577 [Eremomyces bilateralis CBS 781.70]|uniref:Uncharacterized protein n=1 Tax=Eremomyces bilateralis CBS 781.70 TaxID=1392243 RepID=A0A6G1FY98_9PEZI|nr:uncharacterized protein P152DRAFT_400577 [Eremomyces bilateralis CBS 781.70]KAF1810817.1 hypothetical protein P152DRAFT_400577 [Eremomyces bilateralis CBS 781.70]